jgi:hypothetical protein
MDIRRTILSIGAAFGLAVAAVPQATAAITHRGAIAANNTSGVVVLQSDSQIAGLGMPVLKFKFAAPASGDYKMRFCFGPTADPCGSPSSYVVTLKPTQERLAVINPRNLATGVLLVTIDGQAAVDPVPFDITLE